VGKLGWLVVFLVVVIVGSSSRGFGKRQERRGVGGRGGRCGRCENEVEDRIREMISLGGFGPFGRGGKQQRITTKCQRRVGCGQLNS
jgi:hypothetical protein